MSDNVLTPPVKTQKAASNGRKPQETTKWVYLFNEIHLAEEHVGGSWDETRALLGGKGANLAI